jgi:hypothetical protein
VTAPSGVVVSLAHVRAVKICAPGVRAWFTRHLDRTHLRQLCRGELPVEVIEAIDDELAHQVAAIARQEAARGQ